MAGPISDVPVLAFAETKEVTSTSIDSPAPDPYGNGQTHQFSGVLIKLIKVPLGGEDPFTSTIPSENSMGGTLRKPSMCWICRRLVACLSRRVAGQDTTFSLRTSTSYCQLNHEILIAIRIFLEKNSSSPDIITVESASLGPLRLVLARKRPHAEESGTAHSDQCETSNSRTPKHKVTWISQALYIEESYDLYQDLQVKMTGAPITWIPKASRIAKSSQSKECLTLAKLWLDECLRDHPRCRTSKMPKLPHRVIDVQRDGLRLYVPHDGTRGRWVALSHCWGKTNTLKTTLNTLEAHQHKIEWKQLPQTFQDAVSVTRALGVQYLWIDSLCIIQDDEGADFHEEAAKMCDIYRDSVLTIAASCSASDSAGFLRDRMVHDPIEINKPPRLSSIHVRQSVDHLQMVRDDPIHSRAWTFQEAILPRRLLSFGSCEATWECETLRQCECRQIGYEHERSTDENDLGREAYRKVTKPLVERGRLLGEEHPLPSSSDHFLRPDPRSLMLDVPVSFPDANGTASNISIIEAHKLKLLAEAPPEEDPSEYFEYIDEVRRRTMRAVETAAAAAPAPPVSRDAQFSEFRLIQSRALSPQDVVACVEWLQTHYRITLAVTDFYRYWRRVLVPEYTGRVLSKDSDRLIALQAIASDVHSEIQDRYLAGLWEGDLSNQLCWKSADGRNLPANNQSPSWSWSSIHGPVVPYLAAESEGNSLRKKELTVVSAECSLAGQNPCGKILNGCITLEAQAMEVRYVKNEMTGLFEFYAYAPGPEHLKPVVSLPLAMEFSPDTPLGCQADGTLTRSVSMDCLDSKQNNRDMSAILLFVKLTSNLSWCVLVCARVSAEPKTCRRLGIGTLHCTVIERLHSVSEDVVMERFLLI